MWHLYAELQRKKLIIVEKSKISESVLNSNIDLYSPKHAKTSLAHVHTCLSVQKVARYTGLVCCSVAYLSLKISIPSGFLRSHIKCYKRFTDLKLNYYFLFERF